MGIVNGAVGGVTLGAAEGGTLGAESGGTVGESVVITLVSVDGVGATTLGYMAGVGTSVGCRSEWGGGSLVETKVGS